MQGWIHAVGMLMALAGTGIGAAPAAAEGIAVSVSAEAADCGEGPVALEVPAAAWRAGKRPPRDALATPCQVEEMPGGKVRLTFVVGRLRKGERKVVHLIPAKGSGVDVRPTGKNVEVRIGGALFTRYDVSTGPTKPYFYPIQAFGRSMARHWPLEDVAGEEKDHPHHRGLWFTHGLVNGVDFWAESGTAHPIGKTVHAGFADISSGPVTGAFSARTDWTAPDGTVLLRDERRVVVTPLPSGGILLDFSIALRPASDKVVFGDTKEGTFAIRVPESMKADKGGTLVNAEGLEGAKLWGKPSAWNDYNGPVDGETVGIAILDHPSNPRHPTTWHSRTYGLFAVNPFGWHDFDAARRNEPHAGDLVLEKGATTTFRYRVYFHKGNTAAADVAGAYAAWATPPTVRPL